MNRYLTLRSACDAAGLAWVDGLSTAVEGALLWRGNPLGEWIVVVALAILVPFERLAIIHRPNLVRLIVLVANAIVGYLIYGRIGRRDQHSKV